jgi:hypothetical protein
VKSLKPLEGFRSLTGLVIAGSMWTTMTVETLAPLAALADLRFLHLGNLKALDRSLEPLSGLTRLTNLELPNFYSVEEYAKLSARLEKTECAWFSAFVPLRSISCPQCARESMVVLTGKGTTTVCRSCEESRVLKHEELFKKLASRAA